MLKAILIEFIEIYIANEIRKKTRVICYFSYFFATSALCVLFFSDYIYLNDKINLLPYLEISLIFGSAFLLLALALKLFSFWLTQRILHKKTRKHTKGPTRRRRCRSACHQSVIHECHRLYGVDKISGCS